MRKKKLAILTPKGRQALADQIEAARIVYHKTNLKFYRTSDDDSSIIDGVAVDVVEGDVVEHAEIKSRDMTMRDLTGPFKWEWIITASKLDFIRSMSVLMCIPAYGILYMKPEKMCLKIQFYDESGAITCNFRTAETETQETCNGGRITRLNAFVDMRKAEKFT